MLTTTKIFYLSVNNAKNKTMFTVNHIITNCHKSQTILHLQSRNYGTMKTLGGKTSQADSATRGAFRAFC